MPLADLFSKLRGAAPGAGDASAFASHRGGSGVLCLHGFTGTPYEVKPLAENLAHHGFSVAAPVLAGHGRDVETLATTRWPDWLQSAEAALSSLLRETREAPVGIAGFSMGGLLALRLARLHPHKVAALMVMAAPLRLRRAQVRAVEFLAHLPAFARHGILSALPKLHGFDVTDEEAKRLNPGLPALPVGAAASMMELAAVVRRDLPWITVPTLVAHGEKDRTVPMNDSLELVGSLGAAVETLWLPNSGHLLAVDVDRALLQEKAARFFSTHLKAPAPGTVP